MINRALFFSILSIAVALLAMLGWLTGSPVLASILPKTIPMAPSTGFSFVLIGCIQLLMISPRRGKKIRHAAIAVLSLITLYCLPIVIQYSLSVSWRFEEQIFAILGMRPSERLRALQTVPVGQMSPFTAGLFFLQALALIGMVLWRRKPGVWKDLPGYGSSLVFITASTIVLGYLHGAPMFYGGLVIPMALPTALAFVLQSAACFWLFGRRSFPLRIFLSDSTSSLILRRFLPVGVGTILLHDLTVKYLQSRLNMNVAVVSALSAAGFAWILSLVTVQVSRYVGGQIDRSERARKEFDQLKSQLFNNMSHEMRTPLNAIMGFTDALLEDESTPQKREGLLRVKESSERLLVLVNNLLSLSLPDVSAGMVMQSAPFCAIRTIQNAIDSVIKIKKPSVLLRMEMDERLSCELMGDEERFGRLVSELVSNAFKFTEEGEVCLRALVQSETSERVEIFFEVSDTGKGIPENAKSNIFKPFFQADGSLTRKFGGAGIGLVVSQQIARAFGGRPVEFESREGSGSRFWCTLELMKEKEPELSIVSPRRPVLVVDDDEDNRAVISHHLRKLGCQVDVAENGDVALQKIKQNQYDLVFMDCQMPVMDGFQATIAIRSLEAASNGAYTPIIGCTAHAHTESQAQCAEAGMDGFITKPLNSGILKGVLNQWIKTAA